MLAYLIVRGHKIGEHRLQDMEEQEAAMRSYIRSVSSTPTSDLGKLAELRASGVIDDAEFETMSSGSSRPDPSSPHELPGDVR